jgi:hypothetical protein
LRAEYVELDQNIKYHVGPKLPIKSLKKGVKKKEQVKDGSSA